jgi:hypothetical protein
MKSKILATIVVLALLLGTFTVAYRATPNKAIADTLYHLDVYSDPSAVPASPGAGDYTFGTLVQMNFTDPYIVGNVKYVFQSWDIDAGTWTGTSNPLQYVTMNANHNVTAHYKTQYKVSLGANPFGATDWIWSTSTGWVLTNSLWVDAGDQAKIGVEGLSIIVGPKPGIWTDPYHRWAYCDSFDGDFSGYYNDAVSAWSDPITVNSPKTGTSIWAFYYALYVNSDPNPPVPPPAGQNYYTAGSVVSLTANDYSTNFGVYRYTLDYWTVDGSTRPGNPISVTMDWNHTAIAYYKRQSFVYLEDNVGNASGLQDTGKWYDDGVPYTFTAPTPRPVGPNVQYDFRFWDKPGYAWTNTSNPLCLTFDASWDGEHLRARYQTQYYLMVTSSGSGPVPGFLYPDSVTTGWYDAWSWVDFKARPIVNMSPTKRFVFQQWKNQFGQTNPNNNFTGQLTQPYNLTAEYQLQWSLTWNHSPSSITVTGSPGQTWIADGTDVWYGLPATDTSGQFVFYYWVIDGYTFAQGVNPAHVGTCTGPIDGTAYYANITKVYLTAGLPPGLHTETAPAYCHTFDVTVMAANFDANRIVNGNPMDIYAFDIIVSFPQNLLEVTAVHTNLADFFAPNDYFPKPDGMITINNIAGTVEIVATAKYNYTGFVGTKAMFTITFHVIYDACYPLAPGGGIDITYWRFQNHLNTYIWPESYSGVWYQMNTVKPVVEVRNAADHSNLVKVDMNVPQQYFDVEVYLHDGVKVSDFDVILGFDKTMINVVSVTIATYLQPPFLTYYGHYDNTAGMVQCLVVQDPGVSYQNGSGLLFTVRFKVVNQIYYTIPGPWTLNSVISVASAALSVHCPTLMLQTKANGKLGWINCNYVYNPLPGDLNFDGVVNVLDLQIIVDHYGMPAPPYDLFGDARCDLNDLVFVALRFGNHL